MKELILIKNQLKAELTKQKYIKDVWKKSYKETGYKSHLEQENYVSGIIEGLEKSIKLIENRIGEK